VQGVPDPIHEQRAVGQSGQGVVQRVVLQLMLGGSALGDVRK